MPNIIGYLRQDFNKKGARAQFDLLKAVGATKIFQDNCTGAKQERPQLIALMDEVCDGDTVVVTSLDRIARNTQHMLEIIESLKSLGVSLRVIDTGIDTSTPHGEVISMLLRAICDFERQTVRESQAAGIAKAKREGRYKGRKPTAMAKTDEVLALNVQGLTRQRIAEQLGIGVASVYRILKKQANQRKSPKKSLKKPVDKLKQIERKPTQEPVLGQLSLF